MTSISPTAALDRYDRSILDVLQRDGRISNPFELYDVDCTVKYRMHRGFQREPMSY